MGGLLYKLNLYLVKRHRAKISRDYTYQQDCIRAQSHLPELNQEHYDAIVVDINTMLMNKQLQEGDTIRLLVHPDEILYYGVNHNGTLSIYRSNIEKFFHFDGFGYLHTDYRDFDIIMDILDKHVDLNYLIRKLNTTCHIQGVKIECSPFYLNIAYVDYGFTRKWSNSKGVHRKIYGDIYTGYYLEFQEIAKTYEKYKKVDSFRPEWHYINREFHEMIMDDYFKSYPSDMTKKGLYEK